MALLLLVLGALLVAGIIAYAQEIGFGWYEGLAAAGALVMMATATLIFLHHRYAVPCALLCTFFLTLDGIHQLISILHGQDLSLHSICLVGRAVFGFMLFWAGYAWFRGWRARVDSQPQIETDDGWWPTRSDA